ncbi:methyltransferase domain-containing protein [Dactylosporangium aurantiacum]|uniref:Methyltransferase domain-containing protein n=1 Tax=Dactylosporangium aurantiacum TaxID=35754 RepID=A0A9Q9MG06_9ACTN|nr:methyltransferase domain-containing protein [Dactylosporangium aurantiacum]MDG6102509.1 methyltransferase domain-containing protein [Dactylosporangium aurantiacum]UWZ53215.1 methyltransferase domain-containing protein [Dactylosporangium aurantiacum]
MESSVASPRTAVVWQVLRREIAAADHPLTALDVGGGTGGFAVPLARAGHAVTVVDPSPDALAALTRRAAEAGVAERITAVQGDGDGLADLIPPGSVDLVLCHSMLEVVDDPHKVVSALAATLRPGGVASVVVANRAAAVLAKAIGGHLAAASLLVASPDGRGDSRDRLSRRYDVDTATALLSGCGFTVEQIHGVRIITDLVPGSVAESEPEALQAFELALAGTPPYRDIATQLHLLARKS